MNKHDHNFARFSGASGYLAAASVLSNKTESHFNCYCSQSIARETLQPASPASAMPTFWEPSRRRRPSASSCLFYFRTPIPIYNGVPPLLTRSVPFTWHYHPKQRVVYNLESANATHRELWLGSGRGFAATTTRCSLLSN